MELDKTRTYAQAGVNLNAGDLASQIMYEASRLPRGQIAKEL